MNKSAVIPFAFQSSQVRALTIDGEPWFVARDVCDILELEHITNALAGLDDDELTVEKLQSGGQEREMKLISESGLYTLIIRSNKPQAKPFRRWVTGEVLPSIRKTGGYAMPSSGKRADIFHHRGPVSPGGLDIRYTLDLTKVLLHPTRTRLALLQRLTGVDIDDLAEVAADLSPANVTTDSMRVFLEECVYPLHGSKILLKEAHCVYVRWCESRGIDKFRMASVRLFATNLRKAGYALVKEGNIYLYGVALAEVAI